MTIGLEAEREPLSESLSELEPPGEPPPYFNKTRDTLQIGTA
jgi:hypothetical protein